MMIKPALDEMLEKVDCRYTLVVEVSKRAREIVNGELPLVIYEEPLRAVSIAIDEIHQNKVTYTRPLIDEQEKRPL